MVRVNVVTVLSPTKQISGSLHVATDEMSVGRNKAA